MNKLKKIKDYLNSPEYKDWQEKFRQKVAIPGAIKMAWSVNALRHIYILMSGLGILLQLYSGQWLGACVVLITFLCQYWFLGHMYKICIFLHAGLQATSIQYYLQQGREMGQEEKDKKASDSEE